MPLLSGTTKWTFASELALSSVINSIPFCLFWNISSWRSPAFWSLQDCHCAFFYFAVVVQSLSCVQLFASPWTAACLASLSFTISQSLHKLMSIELLWQPKLSPDVAKLCLCWEPVLRICGSKDGLHGMWTFMGAAPWLVFPDMYSYYRKWTA